MINFSVKFQASLFEKKRTLIFFPVNSTGLNRFERFCEKIMQNLWQIFSQFIKSAFVFDLGKKNAVISRCSTQAENFFFLLERYNNKICTGNCSWFSIAVVDAVDVFFCRHLTAVLCYPDRTMWLKRVKPFRIWIFE